MTRSRSFPGDVVKDDLLANSEKGVVSKRSVSFAEDSNPESENSSMFVDACSQDVTLDFYEGKVLSPYSLTKGLSVKNLFWNKVS